ncbi:hypothetical protein H4S14_004127 [Agrobacterium vitis]|nr:hypothetical protein [Agrobacterium vitis]MBE1440353.1 hypothetical protein [Agrobacterium vitis]
MDFMPKTKIGVAATSVAGTAFCIAVTLKPVAVNRIHCDRLWLFLFRMYVIVLLRTIKRDML